MATIRVCDICGATIKDKDAVISPCIAFGKNIGNDPMNVFSGNFIAEKSWEACPKCKEAIDKLIFELKSAAERK